MSASAVNRSDASDAAFCNAPRTTLATSSIPSPRERLAGPNRGMNS